MRSVTQITWAAFISFKPREPETENEVVSVYSLNLKIACSNPLTRDQRSTWQPTAGRYFLLKMFRFIILLIEKVKPKMWK